MTDPACDTCGQQGDKVRYRPPNELDEDVERLMGLAMAESWGDVPVTINLPPFPTGANVAREIGDLRNLINQRTPAMLTTIEEENEGFGWVFERALGIDAVPRDRKYYTALLMSKVTQFVHFYLVREKDRFNRPRPVQLDKDLEPRFCPGHAAYPSGHASTSYAFALALMDATPGHPQYHPGIMESARLIGWHREVGGMHYRSDSECGVVLATQLMDALRGDKLRRYRRPLEDAAKELEGLLSGRPAPRIGQRVQLP